MTTHAGAQTAPTSPFAKLARPRSAHPVPATDPRPAAAPVPEATRVKRLALNRMGRDFVVGDIHGAYDQVQEAMRLVSFDPARDRIISVGDLIDRGPDSWRCAAFLAQPFVHAVRGNHDDNYVEIFKDGEPSAAVFKVLSGMFGMQWALSVGAEQRLEIARALAGLPLVIEIETLRGTVGVVHGDIPVGWGWQRFVAAIERGDKAVIQCALEGRDRLNAGDESGVGGIGRVFVGHTPQANGPKRFGNVYAIDTGAIYNVLKNKEQFALTMVNVASSTAPLVNLGAGGMSPILVIDQAESEEPFGEYACASPGMAG
ncbi:MAG: hypothetical protein E6Q67_00795 [Roseateles sp.]|nr:MAG: hypothetical protein E6Q67_00795 [Roseateles sp.]